MSEEKKPLSAKRRAELEALPKCASSKAPLHDAKIMETEYKEGVAEKEHATTEMVAKFLKDENLDPNTTPLANLIDLKERGLSDVAIAKLCDVDPSIVRTRLDPYRGKIASLNIFKKNRIGIFQLLQNDLLSSITPEEIKGMGVKDRIIAASVLFDKEQLAENKGQNNVTIHFNFLNQFATPADTPAETGQTIIDITPLDKPNE